MRARTLTLVAALSAIHLLSGAGCQSSRDRHVERMMWYRPSTVSVVSPNSITVGRYGREAEFGVWPGFGVAGEWTDRPLSLGRAGYAAEYSTWGTNDVGGEPIPNASVSSIAGTAGPSLGVTGGSTTVGETSRRDGASYGTTP